MRRIAVLDAPSNLGLRPPTDTSVPGCAKAPGALRDQGLLARLGARDAGCLTAPRYDPGDWRPGDGVAHADSIGEYSRRLADRIEDMLDRGEFPVVLGGDCSIVIGAALAMRRLGQRLGERIGLVYVDGHSDFRHPGNASYVGAAAGEGLALVTGRGQTDLASIERRRPYVADGDVVLMGIRAHDDYRLDLEAAGIATLMVPRLRSEGAARSAQWARNQLGGCAGYWVHVDVDVLDPAVMPAVDAPDPGGIAYAELELLLSGLVSAPGCLGIEVTVFDPDYDLDGVHARAVVETLVAGLHPLLAREPESARPSPTRAAASDVAANDVAANDVTASDGAASDVTASDVTSDPLARGPVDDSLARDPEDSSVDDDAPAAEPTTGPATDGPTTADPRRVGLPAPGQRRPVVPAQSRPAGQARSSGQQTRVVDVPAARTPPDSVMFAPPAGAESG